jgi:dipeptide/tripeptide permease
MTSPAETAKPAPFPRSFWTANVTELFERGAYYAMASWVVIYLGQLGLGPYWPSTLNGVVLWGIVYFLPILSGTIADRVGFKKSLLAAFVLLAVGYFLMGVPVWFGGQTLVTPGETQQHCEVIKNQVLTAGPGTVVPVVIAIILIGMGGSIIKPCISGTVQKTAAPIGRATLGFSIFYMIINIGSLSGRGISYAVRTHWSLSYVFAVAMAFCVVAFLTVLIFYREVRGDGADAKPRKTVFRILADMVIVLRNIRFTLFLIALTGFWFIYSQVYNLIPLYLKHVLEKDPAVDIYTMANPFVIVFFQLLITRLFGKLLPIRSIVVGIVIISCAMLLNLVPIWLLGGVHAGIDVGIATIPVGSLFIVFTVAMIAFGELFTSARTYEYIGALAPKGQEGLFLGYANLPVALGVIIGGPVGAVIFNDVMLRGANAKTPPECVHDIDPAWASAGWLLLAGIGLASALGMWLYNRWLKAHPA